MPRLASHGAALSGSQGSCRVLGRGLRRYRRIFGRGLGGRSGVIRRRLRRDSGIFLGRVIGRGLRRYRSVNGSGLRRYRSVFRRGLRWHRSVHRTRFRRHRGVFLGGIRGRARVDRSPRVRRGLRRYRGVNGCGLRRYRSVFGRGLRWELSIGCIWVCPLRQLFLVGDPVAIVVFITISNAIPVAVWVGRVGAKNGFVAVRDTIAITVPIFSAGIPSIYSGARVWRGLGSFRGVTRVWPRLGGGLTAVTRIRRRLGSYSGVTRVWPRLGRKVCVVHP